MYYNQNYRYNPNYNYQNNPFSTPRVNNEIFVNPKKGMDFKRIITNTEKGIDTISSIIPLAQKVTPLISNGKDFIKNIKKQFTKKETKTVKKEKVEAELVEPSIKKEEFIKKEETKPNKPYF